MRRQAPLPPLPRVSFVSPFASRGHAPHLGSSICRTQTVGMEPRASVRGSVLLGAGLEPPAHSPGGSRASIRSGEALGGPPPASRVQGSAAPFLRLRFALSRLLPPTLTSPIQRQTHAGRYSQSSNHRGSVARGGGARGTHRGTALDSSGAQEWLDCGATD